MKKAVILYLILSFAFISNIQAQYKIQISSFDSTVTFIPYINGGQQWFVPVDTITLDVDTSVFELVIHFPDSTVADLKQKVKMGRYQKRIFIIDEKTKFISKANMYLLKLFRPKQYEMSKNLKDIYALKDKTFAYYLKKRFKRKTKK